MTDQGSQFTSTAFRSERVLAAGARCSMNGRGRCLDNVFIERLWRSLKYEAVYLHELADGFAAERVIAAWMTFYGYERPHSALEGRTPAEVYGRGAGGVSNRTTVRGTAMTAIGCSAPRLATAVVERPLLYDALIAIADTGWRFDEQTNAGPLCGGASRRRIRWWSQPRRLSVPHVISGGGTVDLPGCGRPRDASRRIRRSAKRAPTTLGNLADDRCRSCLRFRPRDSHSPTAHRRHGNRSSETIPARPGELATVSADLKTTRA